jgi:uncharacterized membrane protein/glutaredoxin
MNGKSHFPRLFVIMGALSTLYLLLEAVLQSFGKSICATEGCKIVTQFTRFGDLTMVLLGLGTVAVITVLAAQGMRSISEVRDRIVNFLLVVSLAGEGFFVGYQLFRLHAVCVFCLSVFGIFFVLGVLRTLAGHREVLAGFGSLLAVFSLFYLILPSEGPAIPLDQKYILFYSEDCKHCTEIRKELDENKIEVAHVLVKEYSLLLRNLGIEGVPTLMVNGPSEKVFLAPRQDRRRSPPPQVTIKNPPIIRPVVLTCSPPPRPQARSSTRCPKKDCARKTPNVIRQAPLFSSLSGKISAIMYQRGAGGPRI